MRARQVRCGEAGLSWLATVLCNLMRSRLSLPGGAVIDGDRCYGEQLIPHINQSGNSSRRLLRSGLFVLNGVLNANVEAAQQKLAILRDPFPPFLSHNAYKCGKKCNFQRKGFFLPLCIVLSINMHHREVLTWYRSVIDF